MVQKRPFDEEVYGFSCKLPKQSKHDDSQSLFSEFIQSEDNASDIVDSIGWKRKFETEENLYEKNCYFSDDYVRMDKPFFPEFYFPERSVRTVPRREDTYSMLLQQLPQKLVPLGPDHQADIPPWNPSKAIVDNVQTHVGQDEGDELSGISVIPMPDSDSSECKVGAGRTNCCCTDKGSVRCVRHHIMESRGKLEKAIGSDAFKELGFLEMGEAAVAEKQWTEEEERIFHQIVLSYPISMGKSFWSRLSSAFPSRTKREIVSYYFNVFMLRVRAEQNRFDPSGADSDNDEWHLSDDEEEDDDSVVESPLHHFGFVNNTINDDDDDDDDDDGLESDEGCDDGGAGNTWAADGKNASDDSCTSFDSDATVPRPHLNNDSHDYLWDSCDAKLWDVGYMSYQKKEADFLPTCSMIEEVFGDDSWNFKVDGNGL